MIHFTARPGGWQIATRAWASTRDAVGAMPLLFLSAMVLGVAISVAIYIPTVSNLVLVKPKSVGADMMWTALAARTVLTLAWALVAAPVAVAIHRFILMGQTTRGPVSWLPRYTLAFTAWLLAIRLVFSLIGVPVFLLRETGAEVFVLFCLGIAAGIVGIYLTMLFPAVATEVPSKSVSARLETSLAQMSGNFWLLVWALILTFLPVVVLTMAVQMTVMRQVMIAAVAGTAHGSLPVAAMIGAGVLGVVQIISVALVAAAASWLYSWISPASLTSSAAAFD